MSKAKTLPATILPADTELTCMYCERKATKIFEGRWTYCDECLKAAYAGTRTQCPQENTAPTVSAKVSVKVQAKKQLTVARKEAGELAGRMMTCPYSGYLYAERHDDVTFLRDHKKDLPLWKDAFIYMGKELHKLLDAVDQCEAACREVSAKTPEWYLNGQGLRDWLAEYDITPTTPTCFDGTKPDPTEAAETSESQPFDREPNADDAHHMRGMGIRWDN